MSFLSAVLHELERGLTAWIVVAAILTMAELLLPRERDLPARRLAGVVFWLASIPATAVLTTAFVQMRTAFGIPPLLTLPAFGAMAWAGPLAGVAAILLGAAVNDFFFYWFHRIQHRWLWRFHAVHHSIRDLNAVNCYHHISETLFGLALFTLPATLIVSDTGPVLPLVNLLLYLHLVWIHSPTRFHFGPLRAVFADNRFHRIHHSLEERHFDRNFGAFTTIWDRLFGTLHMPDRDEWPAVGLAEVDQPRSLREWFDLPGRYRAATGAAGDRDSSGRRASA